MSWILSYMGVREVLCEVCTFIFSTTINVSSICKILTCWFTLHSHKIYQRFNMCTDARLYKQKQWYEHCYSLTKTTALSQVLSYPPWKSLNLSSVVRLSVNFSRFHLLLKMHWANFNQTWHKAFLGEGNSDNSNEGPRPFSRGNNYETAKIHWRNFKIFSKTTEQISQKQPCQFQPNSEQNILG